LNILIADDHELYIKGVRLLLEHISEKGRYFEAKNLYAVMKQLEQHPVDLLLLDLRMPDMEGFDGVYQVRTRFPDLPIVIITSSESRTDIRSAIHAGVQGYILKSLEHEQMEAALQQVLSGEAHFPDIEQSLSGPVERLTQRQQEILYLINDGMGNREIATHLGITEGTVSQHVHSILRALEVKSRSEAARILRQYG